MCGGQQGSSMDSVVQPNAWLVLRLPSGNTKVLQIAPNTTISLGKYGSFPSNLLIDRPYHLTYELQDRRPGETFNRLRVVPSDELYADVLADTASSAADDSDNIISAVDGIQYTLVDAESGDVVVQSNREIIDDPARQTLSMDEIEELKRDGSGAGKDLITKLMLSHTALDQKTSFSLAKYKLLKEKKYMRRFSILPFDIATLGRHLLEDRDSQKIMDLREEMIALLGCWANVHHGGDGDLADPDEQTDGKQGTTGSVRQLPGFRAAQADGGGRWLVIDDTGGLLVGAMAERMGILYGADEGGKHGAGEDREADQGTGDAMVTDVPPQAGETLPSNGQMAEEGAADPSETTHAHRQPPRRRPHDFHIPYARDNTLTVIHTHSQANLSLLQYYGFDITAPNPPPHPLATHLLPISWLQLMEPGQDPTYAAAPPEFTPDVLASWKSNRRGNYHRKRRRWARTRYIVDSTRAGGFSGLVAASTMDPVSVLRATVPLLAGGAPVALYSPTIEPLTELADCFSIGRRTAWATDPPAEAAGKTLRELEGWEGNEDFPINPTMLLGVTVSTSRARHWQVLPGRTHPLMTGRGGSEGYIFTAWKVLPAEGKVEARGRFAHKRRKVADDEADASTPSVLGS